MRKGNLLFSAVQFIFVMLVVLLGLFLIGLQKAPHLRCRLGLVFSDPSVSFSGVGYLILTSGLFLLIGFCAMYKGRYYQLKMGRNKADVDVEVIRQAVSHYWRQNSPHVNHSVQIGIARNQQLEICLELPLLPIEEQELLFEKVERELGELLRSQFGYKKEFLVTVSLKG